MNAQSAPTFDEIRNILKESSIIQKETKEQMKRFSEESAARKKEIDEQIKNLSTELKQTDRHIQKVGGRFNQRWGALVESLVEGKLVKIFQTRGIDITQTHSRSVAHWKKTDGTLQEREFDIIVANGTEIVEVEVKTTLTRKDVKVFLERIRDFKKFFPRYKTEILYGAVAYLNSEDGASFYAEEQGLFIIKATGDSASLVNRKNFRPKPFV